MRSTMWWLGLTFGTLSVVMLIKHGFEVNFVASLQIVLDTYDRMKALAFGWLEPSIRDCLVALKERFSVDLNLQPHWRDVAVLMGLYFIRDNSPQNGAHAYTILLNTLVCAPIFVLASILVGTIPTAGAGLLENYLFAAIPLAAVFMYRTLNWGWSIFRSNETKSWSELIGTGARYWFRQFFFPVFLFMFLGLLILPSTWATSPGILMLGAAMFALAGYYVWVAVQIVRHDGKEGMSWLGALRMQGLWLVGTSVFATLLGGIAFLVTNAGLKLAGL